MPASPRDPNLYDQLTRVGAKPPEAIELLDHVEDLLLWMKDAEGHYEWFNRAFMMNFNIPDRTALIGQTDFDICGLVLANQYRIDDERVLAGERIRSRVELVGRFDHTSRWCLTSKIPLHNEQNEVVGTMGISQPLGEIASSGANEGPLSPAIRHISQHYNEALPNLELAKLCGLSLRAFERQFLAEYGLSPHEYVRNLRVRVSCQSLVFSRKPLAEIATEFGFSDQSHFTKEFRRLMKETPRAYRLRYAAPEARSNPPSSR